MKKNTSFQIFSSPLFFGVAAGMLAVLAQPIFHIQPPQAYGICTVCHARDLLNWFSRLLFAINIEAADVSIAYPLLTTIGLVIGAFIASRRYAEFRRIRGENLLFMFLLGMLVANVGLLIMSCPSRLVLRFAFGDPYALLALLGLIVGITTGVMVLKWRVNY
jgi:multidrug transporter EmrE-like cation transporter